MFLENVWPGKVAIAVIIALVQLLPRGEPTRDDYVRRTYDYVGFFGPNFAPGKTAPELVSKWSSTAIFPSEEKTLFWSGYLARIFPLIRGELRYTRDCGGLKQARQKSGLKPWGISRSDASLLAELWHHHNNFYTAGCLGRARG